MSKDGSTTRIVNAAQFPPSQAAKSSVEIPLQDASAALSKQVELLNKKNLGQYDKFSNSCVSHVCDVLQAGGVSTPSAAGTSQIRFLKNLLKEN